MIRRPVVGRIVALLVLLLIAIAFVYLDLGSQLTVDSLKARRGALQHYYAQHPVYTLAAFFAVYALSTGASLPAATFLTVTGGALFGVVVGSTVVAIASTVGATLAFLSSRFLLRDFVQSRFQKRLQVINAGMEESGLLYLFSLRLVPVVPFNALNLAMGVTKIPLRHYSLVSLVGMLPATILYANAGTQLARLESLSDILSLDIALSFAALALLPFVARRLLAMLQSRTRQRG